MPDPINVKRGALPTPRSVLASARPYVADARLGAPAEYIVIPPQLSMWGNDVYGDCVTAEEAFAKACYQPEIFITDGELFDLEALAGFNPEYANFRCPQCRLAYCRDHWRGVHPVFDDGFYDATYGWCPEAHKVMIDD